MEYRKLEGKEISEIGMGCYPLSGAYGPVKNSAYEKVLNRAVELGINFFDTADTYGAKAEEILGRVVKSHREEIVLQTKVGITQGSKPDLSYDSLYSACEKSLERLQTSYIDYYLIHFSDPETPVKETIAAMEDLKDDGMIRGYGVGHISFEELKDYHKKGDISTAMMELSPVERGARQRLLPFCEENGINGIAFSVTGRGMMTGKFREVPDFEKGDIRNIDPLFKHARFQSALRVLDKFETLAERYEKTPVQVAINWVLNQPGIKCALTGPSSKEHLEENIGGCGWKIYKEDLEELEMFFEGEDVRLREEELEVIKRILTQEKEGMEPSRFIGDLVYSIESSIKHQIVDEKEVIPLFRRVLSMRGDPGKDSLREVQKDLRDIIL
ncbi:MAG: aldo/keto reductase [Thermoplasmatota archaeon]